MPRKRNWDRWEGENSHVSLQQTLAFRLPDEEFVERFNSGMDVTGLSVSQLCIEAIRAGLETAVENRMKRLQENLQRWQEMKAKGKAK